MHISKEGSPLQGTRRPHGASPEQGESTLECIGAADNVCRNIGLLVLFVGYGIATILWYLLALLY